MREIKFRAKAGLRWCYGEFYHSERNDPVIYEPQSRGKTLEGIPYDGWRLKVDPETVGQYTGLKDNYGGEIYEGDILRYTRDNGVVFWNSTECRWCIEMGDGEVFILALRNAHFWHVIGNIYDNPELLTNGNE